MPSTNENLQNAFAGESQANRRYLAFAKQAEKEGFTNVGKLFRTAAEAETIHAHGHLNAMDGVADTAANLKSAVGGETYEFTEMYPPMLEQAEAEGHKAKRMFKFAMEAEKRSMPLFIEAVKRWRVGKDMEGEVYLCSASDGHVEWGLPATIARSAASAPEKYVLVA